MRDYGLDAQRAAEDRLELCYEDMDREYGGDGPDPETAFCGCTTCVVREVLTAAYPILRKGVLDECEVR